MSDFLLDMRAQSQRALNTSAEQLRFAERTTAIVIERPEFGLVLTFAGDPGLWTPHYQTAGCLVAFAGRPVFDDREWAEGLACPGESALAARVISARYRTHGARALEQLNGNCAVIVHDEARQQLHLVTDRSGVFPTFEADTDRGRVYCSHPDVLANAIKGGHRFDEVSLAEFILTGTVTPPFSYYQQVRASDHATVHTLDLTRSQTPQLSKRRYFDSGFRGGIDANEDDLAGQLAAALREAVRRRTLPRLGPVAVALSGGLDSRVVLASTGNREHTLAFSCYDQPNREFRTAEAIARRLSIPFLPLQRGPDYYAEHAERGVRISAGMGSLANNHFLGVLPRLQQEGIETLLTGCYCDYLFKGLPLNRRIHPLTGRESLAPFRDQFYFDHVAARTPLGEAARERSASRIPKQFHSQDTDAAVFEVEARRTFPLSYEGDNQQRLVPQRIMGWTPPFVDRDVLELYRRVPYRFKLNRSIFRKVAVALTPSLREIPDANTGAALGASPVAEILRASEVRLSRAWRRLHRSGASDESWPDWTNRVTHGGALEALWKRPNADAMSLFKRVLGPDAALDNSKVLQRNRPFLFLGLLTAKLWMDQRR